MKDMDKLISEKEYNLRRSPPKELIVAAERFEEIFGITIEEALLNKNIELSRVEGCPNAIHVRIIKGVKIL